MNDLATTMPSALTEPGLLRRLDATGYPLLLARLVLGGMFIYMGWSKAADPFAFLKLVRTYQVFPTDPPQLINSIAIVFPWLEIFCGSLLILGVCVRGAAGAMGVMLVAFTWLVFDRAWGMHTSALAAEAASTALGAGSAASATAGGTAAAGPYRGFCSIAFDCGCGGGAVNICRKLAENTGLFAAAMVGLFSKTRRFCLVKKR